jgi:Protein of unknown function (DUF3306)
MPVDDAARPRFSLKRWSQRKLEAARPVPAAVPANGETAPPAASAAAAGATDVPLPAVPLPAIDSLSFESDFTAFLKPSVDESLKRRAMKKLFSDPHFNVMDGLDTYIGDYSQPDPLPPGMLEQLLHARAVLDPPRTRVNEQGVVEDVPREGMVASGSEPADAAPALPDAAPATSGVLPEAMPRSLSPAADPKADAQPVPAARRNDPASP